MEASFPRLGLIFVINREFPRSSNVTLVLVIFVDSFQLVLKMTY